MSYYYLISSLPMLFFGEKPPMSSEDFMSACSDWLSPPKFNELNNVSLIPSYDIFLKNNVAVGWNNWETCLRNRIAKARSGNLDKDAAQYIKEERNAFSYIDHAIQEAFSADNPKQKEKVLDELRWKELDNLESGHLFDLGKLCIYKIRLLLCEKWMNREYEKGQSNLDNTLAVFYTSIKSEEEEEENT